MSDKNNINATGKEDENFLFGKNKELPFSLPTRYFDALSDKIKNKIEAEEELSSFALLSEMEKKSAFDVPAGYFSSLENEVEFQAELEEFAELSRIGKPVLKPVSAEYFDKLGAAVTHKIEQQEELKQFETLYSISKQQNFEVSPAYFDTLADKVKERIHSGNSESVLQRIILLIFKPKFAVTFGLVAVTAVAGVLYLKSVNNTVNDGDCKTLACLEKREMLNEHTIREMDEDNLYEMVDVDKLDQQIGQAAVADSAKTNTQTEIEKKN